MAEPSDPTIRLTYTKLARQEPPPQGSIVTLSGFSADAMIFRVTSEPEMYTDGAFSIEVEPA